MSSMESLVVILSLCMVLQWLAIIWIVREMTEIQVQIGDALKLVKKNAEERLRDTLSGFRL